MNWYVDFSFKALVKREVLKSHLPSQKDKWLEVGWYYDWQSSKYLSELIGSSSILKRLIGRWVMYRIRIVSPTVYLDNEFPVLGTSTAKSI